MAVRLAMAIGWFRFKCYSALVLPDVAGKQPISHTVQNSRCGGCWLAAISLGGGLLVKFMASWQSPNFNVSAIKPPPRPAMITSAFVLESDVSIRGLDEKIRIGWIVYLVINYHCPVKPMGCVVPLNNYPTIVPLPRRNQCLIRRRNDSKHCRH